MRVKFCLKRSGKDLVSLYYELWGLGWITSFELGVWKHFCVESKSNISRLLVW